MNNNVDDIVIKIKNDYKLELIEYLINEENVNKSDRKGRSLLFYAASSNSKEKYELIKYLLSLGANVNHIDPITKLAVIHLAASLNEEKLMEVLLESKNCQIDVDIETQTKKMTPLFFASQSNYTNCMAMLLNRGANQDLVFKMQENIPQSDSAKLNLRKFMDDK